METNSDVVVRRSLVGRLWKPATAVVMATLSGGGAYWHWSPSSTADTDRTVARSAPTATDELKNLFAEEKSEPALSEQAQQLFGSADTPVDTVAEEAETTSNFQVASAPADTYGDRYSNYTTAMTLPPLEAEPEDELEEVTRGQGPDANPLRMASQEVEVHPVSVQSDARAAFADAVPQSPQTSGVPIQNAANPLATALDQAQPLSPIPAAAPSTPVSTPPQTDNQSLGNNPFASAPVQAAPPQTNATAPTGRYASAQPMPSLPPAVDMRSSDAGATSREPTPAFELEESEFNSSASQPTIAPADATSGFTPTPGLTSQVGTGRPGEKILEGTQSPSITIHKLAPPEIQVGKRCTFAIRVQNTGQRTAQNVQIHDEIPLGTQLVGTAPRAAVSGSKVVWDLGTLSVGEQRTVEMELIPAEEGELGSVATVTLAAQASAKARCTKPELALRLSSQPQVHVGEKHLVQIEVSNPGSGEASSVMLLETVPAGVSHEAGPALEFELGNLAPGQTQRLELVLTAEQAGRITNTMTARADAGLLVEASCDFEVIAPELRLTVDGPERRFLERPATYQVSIENPGTAPAKEVQLVAHLTKGMQFVSANNLGEYDAAQHSVFWSLAELPANERGMVELVALPVEPGQHTLQVSTKARDGLTDQTVKEVTVEGIAALMFEVIDRDDPIEVGGEANYEIRVTNQGSKAAANVQVVAVMPAGLRALSGNGDTQTTVQGDRVVFAPIPQLGPKAEATFRIQAQGVQAGDQRLSVQVTTDEIRDPITKEESTRVYSDH
ncbi:DUF11 domain-containing protein [Bythopirellula goksoeyrii]|uniref:Large cysteine-rich periplasmic protein omcB n=1 Tax=Bythopirellula goksoeyrii TaxID=1400387 RepID=A0A5B9QGM0_9BACT|nr:DUF11 domain-containing protein [Bythopirellula goksoeyrii]QEG37934.1 Large cysteine-rich periplasmic protein omcB precursor [Bythopirellula goksoeyrii]